MNSINFLKHMREKRRYMNLLSSSLKMIKRAFNVMWLSIACVICINNVHATQATPELTEESKQLLQQLQTQIKVTLLSVSKQEQKVGRKMSHFHYQVKMPAMQEANIGLSLDLEDLNNGFTVVAVAKGSLADKLNIKARDSILSVNGKAVNIKSKNQIIQIFQKLVPGDVLDLVVMQGQEKNTIRTTVVGRQIPEYSLTVGDKNAVTPAKSTPMQEQCGVVTVKTVPPSIRDIYAAYIMNIDGRGVDTKRTNFKLSPGKHTIRVHELISGGSLSRHRSTMQIAKTLEVHIEPNMKYYLGARFVREKRSSRLKEEFWQPVIWKISEQECQ